MNTSNPSDRHETVSTPAEPSTRAAAPSRPRRGIWALEQATNVVLVALFAVLCAPALSLCSPRHVAPPHDDPGIRRDSVPTQLPSEGPLDQLVA
jgi:hypothetical protein